MAKKNKDNKRGLGRGLDSLIPKIDDGEEEKSNKSSLTLEDILSNSEDGENEINKETTEKTSAEKEEEKDKEEKEEKKDKEEKEEKKDKEEIKGKTPNVEIKDITSKNEEISTNKDEELAKETEKTKEETAESDKNVDTITEELREEKITDNNTEKNEETEKDKKEEEKEFVLSDYELASVEEVKEIIEKNPRITLWSAKSSAVFRYLRKTRPEFSISKEASELIDKAVSEKYPEIWELFEDL